MQENFYKIKQENINCIVFIVKRKKNLRFAFVAFDFFPILGLFYTFLELLMRFQNLSYVGAKIFKKFHFTLSKQNSLFCVRVFTIYEEIYVTYYFLHVYGTSLKAKVY